MQRPFRKREQTGWTCLPGEVSTGGTKAGRTLAVCSAGGEISAAAPPAHRCQPGMHRRPIRSPPYTPSKCRRPAARPPRRTAPSLPSFITPPLIVSFSITLIDTLLVSLIIAKHPTQMQHVPAKARMHAGTGSAGVSWYGPGGSSSSSSFGNGSGGTGYATSEANTAQASSSSGSFRRTSRATSALDDNGAGPSSGAASNSGVASTSTSSTASRVARRASPSRTSQSPPSPPHRSSSLRSSTHVEAIHDFDPSIMTANASLGHNKYLSLRAGELILVQGRDPTGWWSGEVTGEDGRPRRGWFPSNYVRELELEDVSDESQTMTDN